MPMPPPFPTRRICAARRKVVIEPVFSPPLFSATFSAPLGFHTNAPAVPINQKRRDEKILSGSKTPPPNSEQQLHTLGEPDLAHADVLPRHIRPSGELERDCAGRSKTYGRRRRRFTTLTGERWEQQCSRPVVRYWMRCRLAVARGRRTASPAAVDARNDAHTDVSAAAAAAPRGSRSAQCVSRQLFSAAAAAKIRSRRRWGKTRGGDGACKTRSRAREWQQRSRVFLPAFLGQSAR